LLLIFSLIRHPIFGHRRYLLFVSPAYLLLLARGVASLRWQPRIVFGLVAAYVALATMPSRNFKPDRSHFREAAAIIRATDPAATIVLPTHGTRVCLGYYMGGWESMKLESDLESSPKPERIWHVNSTVLRKEPPVIDPKITTNYLADDLRSPTGLRLVHMHRKDNQVAEGNRSQTK
jgi:hypothetical protein